MNLQFGLGFLIVIALAYVPILDNRNALLSFFIRYLLLQLSWSAIIGSSVTAWYI